VRTVVLEVVSRQKNTNKAQFLSIVGGMENKTETEITWERTFNEICKRTFKLDRDAFNQMKSVCENSEI